MRNESNKSEPEVDDLAAFVELLYNDLPLFIRGSLDEMDHVQVRDVMAAVHADNGMLTIVAGEEITRQSLDPGTYLIIQLDGLTAVKNTTPGLYGFPLTDGEILEAV